MQHSSDSSSFYTSLLFSCSSVLSPDLDRLLCVALGACGKLSVGLLSLLRVRPNGACRGCGEVS